MILAAAKVITVLRLSLEGRRSACKERDVYMRIALAQMRMEADIRENYQKTIKLITETADKGTDLICFPEIQFSPFFPQYPSSDVKKYSLTLDNDYVKGIQTACRENNIYDSLTFISRKMAVDTI